MATIILNGVATDTNPLAATALNDKLTVSGGLNGYEADMLAGNDLVEIDQAGENVSASTVKGGEGNDSLTVDSSAFVNASSSVTLSGGTGDDTILVGEGDGDEIPAGMVTFTGKANGNDGDDYISVVRADAATLQGASGDDTIELGWGSDLDGPGSRGDTTFDNSSVNGGSGDDYLDFYSSVKATNTTVNGGKGNDTLIVDGSLTGDAGLGDVASGDGFSSTSVANTGDDDDRIIIESSASLVNTLINGNAGADVITADAALVSTEGSIIAAGSGHDHVSVANAGALTVRGGNGKDMLRVGSGQTVVGGANADTFSIEAAGGAIIEDFDAQTENCFCSDVIQVDGNKIIYDTYEYKATKDKYTSASSYAGNIKVKAFEVPVYDTDNCLAATAAVKTHTLNATAYAKYQISNFDSDATFGDLATPAFPATFNNQVNGNSPRPNNEVLGIGFGYGSVEGVITDRGVATEVGNGDLNYRSIYVPNLTVYTRSSYEKGDFSFLNETANGTCNATVTQKLVFDDVTRGTITNHWVDFGFSKTTVTTSLYELKFGTANFEKITTGKANLVITQGLVDKTYYPTPNQITNNALNTSDAATANAVVATITQTAGGKYGYSRKNVKNGTANAELNLSSNTFNLFTKRNGIDAAGTVTKAFELSGESTTVKGFAQTDGFYSYPNIGWSTANAAGLLNLTVATNIVGQVYTKTSAGGDRPAGLAANTPAMNVLDSDAGFRSTTSALGSGFIAKGIINTRQIYQGNTAKTTDTRTARGSLVAKISMTANGDNNVKASLGSWLGRAIIKGEDFTPTSCFFDNPLTPDYIAGGVGGNQHNMWTPASVSTSNKGVFGTKYLWTSGGNKLGTEWSTTGTIYVTISGGTTTNSLVDASIVSTLVSTVISSTTNSILSLGYSNGCTSFSCESTTVNGYPTDGTSRVNAKDAIFGIDGLGTNSGLIYRADWSTNQAFFSASKFTPVALAAEGMGDYAGATGFTTTNGLVPNAWTDPQGAPFRVLFFDNEGADNGLYVMSGTANYKNGDVTAINTNSTAPSGMGGKQTIVNVTGGKGYDRGLALSDINFV